MVLRQTYKGFDRCDLHIPHKEINADIETGAWGRMRENWLAIERWARYTRAECNCPTLEHWWSQPDILDLEESVAWQANEPRTLVGARLTIGGSVDSSPISIAIARNGVNIGTLTIPAGENWKYIDITSNNTFGKDGEFLTIQCTDLGAGEATKLAFGVYLRCGGSPGEPPEPGGGGE